MVSMVSMEVSKTLGPGSSPGTPAIDKEIKAVSLIIRQTLSLSYGR
jgi:hypothetical protein